MKEELTEQLEVPKNLLSFADKGGVFADEKGELYFICRYKKMEDFVKSNPQELPKGDKWKRNNGKKSSRLYMTY